MFIETAIVEEHVCAKGAYRLITLTSPKIAAAAQPGQFVHLRVPGMNDLTLRRPFSIFRASSGRIGLLYKLVGAGTHAMARILLGEKASIMGPLGRGFPAPADGAFPILIGGGYGMAALFLVAERSSRRGLAIIGAKTAEDALCEEDFRAIGWETRISTENGAAGRKGLATDLLDEWLGLERASLQPEVFACGPMGMLEAIAKRANNSSWRAWVSLDKPMGCGVGACLACVQRVRTSEPPGWKWARICTEGPVFDSRDILWS